MRIKAMAAGALVIVAACGLVVGVALAQQHEQGQKAEPATPPAGNVDKPALPACPVSGMPINMFFCVAADDGPVYFCGPGCVAKFKANPKEYSEKVAVQREAMKKLPRVQVTCPVSGDPVDKKSFIEKGGQKVYFCCMACQPKFEAEPAVYQPKLAASYTYQTKCPVSGHDIDPAVFVDLPNKERVYFCCKDCPPKFMADMEKYAPNLASQGYKLDVAAVKKAQEAEKAGKPEEKKVKP